LRLHGLGSAARETNSGEYRTRERVHDRLPDPLSFTLPRRCSPSFYMLLASHFILNKTTRVKQHVVYPFIHSSSNWRTADDMLRAIQIPDINPSDLPSHVDFSMVAGEVSERGVKSVDDVSSHIFLRSLLPSSSRSTRKDKKRRLGMQSRLASSLTRLIT
jgi:hypothetical protein